jgi:hypothetical protein
MRDFWQLHCRHYLLVRKLPSLVLWTPLSTPLRAIGSISVSNGARVTGGLVHTIG